MTSSYEPQVGDIVTLTGTVTHVWDGGTISVQVREADADDECLWTKNVQLVERPEPKISVELTRQQLKNLAYLADEYGLADDTREARNIILEALDA